MGGAAFTALTEAVTLLNSLIQDVIILFISIVSVYSLSGILKSLFTTAIDSSEKSALHLMYITFRECLFSLIKSLRDIKILGWCPAESVLPHGEKVPLRPWIFTLIVIGS